MDKITATLMLQGLMGNTARRDRLEKMTPAALEAVRLCLENGADLPIAEGEESILSFYAHRPEGALLLLKAGAPIAPDIVRRLSSIPFLLSDNEEFDVLTEFVIELARRAPDLDWHQVPHKDGLYEGVPAALLIERKAPGFNQALEDAQEAAGMPVGRIPRMTREERIEALFDLEFSAPQKFYLGDRDKALTLAALLGQDIHPDCVVMANRFVMKENYRLLEMLLGNLTDSDMVHEVLSRGATVYQEDIMQVCYLANFRKEELDRSVVIAILRLLVQHAQNETLDTIIARDEMRQPMSPITLREYIAMEYREIAAVFEAEGLQKETSVAGVGSRHHRL